MSGMVEAKITKEERAVLRAARLRGRMIERAFGSGASEKMRLSQEMLDRACLVLINNTPSRL